MRIAPVTLREIGGDVNWAMCRNPMCANFGIGFEPGVPSRTPPSACAFPARPSRGTSFASARA